MKNTLWTFGDSYTYGYSCRPDSPDLDYYHKYYTFGCDIWPNILAKKLKMSINNIGSLNATNDSILDDLINNFDNIQKKDVVILGKTLYQRFDVYNYKKNILWHIGPHSLKDGKVPDNIFIAKDDELNNVCKTNEEYEILLKFIYHFPLSKLHEERQNKRFDFIKNRLIIEKNIKLFYEWRTEDLFFENKRFEDIGDCTEINNIHLSFNGHQQFAEYMYKEINKVNLL